MHGMSVRAWRNEDMDRCVQLCLEHLEESSEDAVSPNKKAVITAFLKRHLQSKDTCLYIAETEGHVVGYLIGALRKSEASETHDHAEVIELYVVKQYRKHGLGIQLVNEFETWAKRYVKLATIEAEEHDAKAIAFWNRQGYRVAWIAMKKYLQ